MAAERVGDQDADRDGHEVIPRAEKDAASEGNPLTRVRHMTGPDGECAGLSVHLWCPGCQHLHGPAFRCPEHGGPESGPVWDGDPHSDPFTMSPSLLVGIPGSDDVCHSFVVSGRWQFLGDCTHALAGQQVPVEPLPDWLVR